MKAKRWETLIEHAGQAVDEARALLERHRQQISTLDERVADIESRRDAAFVGINVYQREQVFRFIAVLEASIQELRQKLVKMVSQEEELRMDLIEAHRHIRSLEHMRNHARDSEAKQQARKQQKVYDELALRRWLGGIA